MAFTRSEQAILDAFAYQRERKPSQTPTYAAQGVRMLRAAESLVEKGLAEVVQRDTASTKHRGRNKSYVYLHVKPALVDRAKASSKPKKKPRAAVERTARHRSKEPKKKVAVAGSKRPHPWTLRLRKAIEQSELSDRELARQAGIAQPMISRFRSGTRGLTFENAAKLAAFLKFRLVR